MNPTLAVFLCSMAVVVLTGATYIFIHQRKWRAFVEEAQRLTEEMNKHQPGTEEHGRALRAAEEHLLKMQRHIP